MGKVVLIGDPHTALPFQLSGVEHVEAGSWDELMARFQELRARAGEVSIVLVAAHLIPEEKTGEWSKLSGTMPFAVLSLPTRWAPPRPVDMKKLLLEALGFG